MAARIIYVPLEGYRERYTMQWSAPVTGWLERNWIEAGIPYVRIDPSEINTGSKELPTAIKTGSVVDAVGRSLFTFGQIAKILSMAENGVLTNDDRIFFDDFWTPGFEALPYAFHLLGVKPKMYAFLHAQSVDEFDFTYPMRRWMRPMERGFAEALDGIFVCGPCLRDLVVQGGIAPTDKVHITGHPFNSEEVLERMPKAFRAARLKGEVPDGKGMRRDRVIWSSRWDEEKNPGFFLNVATEVIKKKPNARFVVCTSAPKIRSNRESLIRALKEHVAAWPNNIFLCENLTKEEYYGMLTESKVQFNCADQDFVAITLLEASVAGCYPIYPYFRSFPETFLHKPHFMYERLDLNQASNLVLKLLNSEGLWTGEELNSRAWIHQRFDYSWIRMLAVMGMIPASWYQDPAKASLLQTAFKDPYAE